NSKLSVSVIGSESVLTYQAGATDQNELVISRSGNTFTFAENAKGVGIDLDGNVYSSVNYDSGLFDRIQVNLEDPNAPDTVANTLTVLSTNKKINVTGGDGNDTVTVGDGGAGGQGMELVTAKVVVEGGKQGANGQDQLILEDRSPAVAGTLVYTVDGAGVTRERQDASGNQLSQVKVIGKNVERLELDASNQNDTIDVNSTLATTPAEIYAGDGDDRFHVGNMDLLAGKLTVHGEGGASNTLTIADSSATSNRNYVLNSGSVVQGTTTIALDTLQGVTIIPPNQ